MKRGFYKFQGNIAYNKIEKGADHFWRSKIIDFLIGLEYNRNVKKVKNFNHLF